MLMGSGETTRSFYRPDLHNELKRVAFSPSGHPLLQIEMKLEMKLEMNEHKFKGAEVLNKYSKAGLEYEILYCP